MQLYCKWNSTDWWETNRLEYILNIYGNLNWYRILNQTKPSILLVHSIINKYTIHSWYPAGNYQLNNWTLYWTGCKDSTSCEATCREKGEAILDFYCLPWPTGSRICACKPENVTVLPSMSACRNTSAVADTDEVRNMTTTLKSDTISGVNDDRNYFTSAVALFVGIAAACELLTQLVIILL